MKLQLLKELDDEQNKMSEFVFDKNLLDTYDERMKKLKSTKRDEAIIFAIAWSLVDVFTSGTDFSVTLVVIALYSLIKVLDYNIHKFMEEKKLEKIDIEYLEMQYYNSEEKMKGLSNAILFGKLAESEDIICDKEKVYLKK